MLPNHTRPLSDAVLLRYTGQTQIRDFDTATALVDEAARKIKLINGKIRSLYFSIVLSILLYCAIYTTIRFSASLRFLSAFVTTGSRAADATITSPFLSFFVTFIVIFLVKPPLIYSLILLFALIAPISVILYSASTFQPSESIRSKQDQRLIELKSFWSDRKALLGVLLQKSDQFDIAVTIKNGISSALNKDLEIKELQSINLNIMTGLEFESFLEKVFTVLEYPEVVKTKASGDQGVDLVIGDGKSRIAVQAKLFQGTVGNDSVQQAFTGMVHYQCNRCVVITNSTFTKSAIELAESTGCKLIDGIGLQNLIAGRDFL
jgi:HJR/Mrr/RecB family endonuclease